MPIIVRKDKDQVTLGLDYLWLWDGESACWSSKDRATDFENAEEIASVLTNKYGYQVQIGAEETERESILRRMKSGDIEKQVAVEMLKSLSPQPMRGE